MIIDAQRIILINGSRLLGDMLQKVISRADHLEMVQKVNRYEELPAAIENTEAEWVLISLPFDISFPHWVDDYLAKHPSIQFLAIFIGSDKVKLKSLEWAIEEELEGISLDDLIRILEGHPQKIQQ